LCSRDTSGGRKRQQTRCDQPHHFTLVSLRHRVHGGYSRRHAALSRTHRQDSGSPADMVPRGLPMRSRSLRRPAPSVGMSSTCSFASEERSSLPPITAFSPSTVRPDPASRLSVASRRRVAECGAGGSRGSCAVAASANAGPQSHRCARCDGLARLRSACRWAGEQTASNPRRQSPKAGGTRRSCNCRGHDPGPWGTSSSIAAEVVAGPPVASMTRIVARARNQAAQEIARLRWPVFRSEASTNGRALEAIA
jgi:hypothetical protein